MMNTNAIISAMTAPGAALFRGLPAARASAPAPKSPGNQNVEAQLSFDKELSQIIITLCDAQTGEVVQQIPPRQVLQFAQFLLEQSTGKMFNARA